MTPTRAAAVTLSLLLGGSTAAAAFQAQASSGPRALTTGRAPSRSFATAAAAADGAFEPAVALTPAGAAVAMAAAEAEAAANGWDVTIVVADAGGVPLQLHRNAFPASAEIAMGKAKTAALFGRNTAALEAAANTEGGSARSALLSAPFVLMRGGVPIVVDGRTVGAVGVSGVAADQDEQVAAAGVRAVLSR